MSSSGPIRTCIGCRQRAVADDLLRVAVAPGRIGVAAAEQVAVPASTPVVPDPRRRISGRGAWVHRTEACVEQALRRRAFARALRVPGPLDPTAVREFLTGRAGEHMTSAPPQEMNS